MMSEEREQRYQKLDDDTPNDPTPASDELTDDDLDEVAGGWDETGGGGG